MRARLVVPVLVTLVAVVAACGGGGSGKAKGSAAGGTTNPAAGSGTTTTTNPTDSAQTGVPTGKIRVFNGYAPKGQPGPTVDFYNVDAPGPNDTPVISGLQYGQLSDYVSPRAAPGSATAYLYMFRTGTKQPSTGATLDPFAGSEVWDGHAGEQATVMLVTDSQSGPNGDEPVVAHQLTLESTPTIGAPILAAPQPGAGTIAVEVVSYQGTTDPEPQVQIDGTCPADVDAQATTPPTSATAQTQPALVAYGGVENFAADAGTHSVGLVLSNGRGFPLDAAACRAAAPIVSASVSVAEGERWLVFFYGPTIKQAKVVVAKVA